uniref:Metalloendopeptidase n=1 Tax=Parastrongyloides trichosuri TaxID=131310 RepID=A0A0N4ZE57_PARTI
MTRGLTIDRSLNIFVYLNYQNYHRKPNDIWFKYDVKSIENKQKSVNKYNISLVKISLSEIYSDRIREKFTLPEHFIAIGICPDKHDYYSKFKLYSDYKDPGKLVNIRQSLKCSLGRCNIGYLVHGASKSGNEGPKHYDGFYIYFDPGPSNLPLVFYGPEQTAFRQMLTACPYINWVDRYNHMEFVPEYYLKEDFFQLEEDYNRHRMIPVFESQQPRTLNNNMKDIVKRVFKCGTLVQNIPNKGVIKIDVVLNLRTPYIDNNKVFSSLFFKKNSRVYCQKSIDITDEIIYGVILKDNTYKKERHEVFHHTGFLKFYSDQRIYVYSKDQIMKDRKEHLKRSTQYNYDRTYFEENYVSYQLICRANVEDFDAILRLRIDNDVVFPTKDNSGKMDEYHVDHSTHIMKILRCGALRDNDRVYKDFYEYKYLSKIKKIKDIKGRTLHGCSRERKIITRSEDDLYGTYECVSDPITNKIKSSTFVILPGKQTYSNLTIKKPFNDKLSYSCNLYDNKHIHIYEMHVTFPEEKPIIYTLFGKENVAFKTIENHHVIYTPDIKNKQRKSAEVICYYNLKGTGGSVVKYNYDHT